MRKNKLSIYLVILAIALSALPAFFCGQSAALAVNANGAIGPAEEGLDAAAEKANLVTDTDAITLAGTIVKTVLSFLGIIFIILLLYAGFLRMTAQGDAAKVKKSGDIIKSAVIGIIIIFVSYIATIFVVDTLSETVGDESIVTASQ